ncbi:MAG TPA: hypothetical protein DDW23_01005 [Planctomycetes bacterium]|nr:hypothetical protein [Planctomycetota bacterium]
MSLLRLHLADLCSRPLLILSALAISLGVGVVFTVTSILDGFLAEFEHSVRSFSGDVVAQPRSGGDWEKYKTAILGIDEVASAKPRLDWFGLIGRRGARTLDDPRSSDLSGLLLVGVDQGDRVDIDLALFESATNAPAKQIGSGEYNYPPIVLGDAVAQKLGVVPGEALEVVSFAPPSAGPARPIRSTYRVAATHAGRRWEESLDRAFVRRTDLAIALGLPKGSKAFTEVIIRGAVGVNPETLKSQVADALFEANLPDGILPSVLSWRDMGGIFLRSVEDQRATLTLVFFFIILVAAWQLVATLVLTVAEKRRTIGILGALGASPNQILTHFAGLGLALGAVGTSIGLLLGVWITRNLEVIESWLGGGKRIFLPEIYQFETIPVAYEMESILRLIAATLTAALVFSLVPAWRASRLRPTRTLTR